MDTTRSTFVAGAWKDRPILHIVLALFLYFSASTAQGQSIESIGSSVGGSGAKAANVGTDGGNSIMLGATVMFFSNQASQGGEELPGGTTTYTRVNLQYNWVKYLVGLGLVYDNNRVGVSQTTNGIGVKTEFSVRGYYIEAGVSTVQNKYKDRAVQSRTGTQTFYGGGIRVPFLADTVYFDGGVRKQVTTYTKQDGVDLAKPLIESVLMPYIGMGISL